MLLAASEDFARLNSSLEILSSPFVQCTFQQTHFSFITIQSLFNGVFVNIAVSLRVKMLRYRYRDNVQSEVK